MKTSKSVYLQEVEKAMAEEKRQAPLPPMPPTITVQHEPLTEVAGRVMRVALRTLSLISQLPEGCSDEDILFVFAQIDGIMREGGYPKIGCVGTDAAHAETFIKISENFRERCPRELHNFYDAWETFVKNHREFTRERERWLTETNIKYQEWKQQQEAQAAKERDGIRNS